MSKISPKRFICALAVFVLVVSSLKMSAQTAPNELKKIDGTVVKVASNHITVKTAEGEVTLTLEEKTEITLAEKPAALADLKDGQEVSILTDGTKAVSIKIAVQSAADLRSRRRYVVVCAGLSVQNFTSLFTKCNSVARPSEIAEGERC